MTSLRSRRRDPLPKFPIGPVLTELGADCVPTGFGWVRMRCPFHDDRNASASVNHDLQGFACMACGVKGDAVALLQSQSGLSFREALERARFITGDETPAESATPKRRRASDLFD